MNNNNKIKIIGGGLAGCEAAFQLASRNFNVELYEMRPSLMTPAHKTNLLAEIVCSNSLGSENNINDERFTASGILKEELEQANSIILKCAKNSRVPAGGALAVDREKFSNLVTNEILNNPKIKLIREEITEIPEENSIIATGPLTSDKLAEKIKNLVGEYVYFYDAVAPVLLKESINFEKVFTAGRYGRGDDYINCPLNKDEYLNFYNELINAERNLPHDFEKNKYFESCMPVEAIAGRGVDTLRFGPMKPKGLRDPKTGREPYAVVQLRQDDSAGKLYNIVGFQTGLKWNEQKRIFKMIPGLEGAEFVRLGVMHRNTSLNAPAVLDEYLRLKSCDNKNIFIAGQLTGVEGYIESTMTGLISGINLARILNGEHLKICPEESAAGALLKYLRETDYKHFQPMNINLGLFPELENKERDKKLKAKKIRDRALKAFGEFLK